MTNLELRIAVAKLLGWKITSKDGGYWLYDPEGKWIAGAMNPRIGTWEEFADSLPPYEEDARDVVEWAVANKFTVIMVHAPNGKRCIAAGKWRSAEAQGPSEARAICEAVLEAAAG